MKVLEKLQQGAGFTRREAIALVTLSLTLLAGMSIKLLTSRSLEPSVTIPHFDYRIPDSIYTALGEQYRNRSVPEAPASPQSTQAPNTSSTKNVRTVINLNTATRQQLIMLPGIGPAFADRILEYRTHKGSFTSVDELVNIKGIGKKKLEQLRPHVIVK